MLHLYYGNDTTAVRERAFAAADKLAEKENARITRIEVSDFAPGMLANLLGAASLWGEREIYVLDTPSEDAAFYAEVVSHAAEMGESANQFVIMEAAMLAPERKKFEKHATTVEESKREAAERFDVFRMAEALSKRDKKSLWVLLQEAKRAGLSAEEIIGTLWWQLKSLRLATLTKTADEAGMKSYPYDKAKRALSLFKPGELDVTSANLLRVYHDGHGGVRDIDEGLEEWVLRG
jgi:DNA polymerase III delta subunit